MRISDWSSDVCSSDFPSAEGLREQCGVEVRSEEPALPRHGEEHAVARLFGRARLFLGRCAERLHRQQHGGAGRLGLEVAQGDRKSVVSGKSVSVRVDLGGRRIIKKKTRANSTTENEIIHVETINTHI